MATQTSGHVANGVATARRSYLRFVTLTAPAANDLTCIMTDGLAGVEHWRATAKANTSQHFVFPDNILFHVGIYVTEDNYGRVVVGWI